ncbi:hypothetical protein [Streptomyces sp. NPDC018347]|uniref:hypothetical protein n=1 Tax=Streptomyces sp. NPDC018347 TaxID=3157193 RepID=UPI003410407F
MRPRTSLSLLLAAAATTASTATATAATASRPPHAARADATPSCAAADARAFPLATRIRGGPPSYEAGGGQGTWYIDLTNTTGRTCTGIHPVVVLTDDKRALRPNQPRLDFDDGSRTRPVTFEATDAHELVGVLDGTGFEGFTVPPGRTVSVRVRLALASDAVPDQVTANAAVVQRRGQDGDWVGESNAYRFAIAEDGAEDPQAVREAGDTEEARQPQDTQPQDTQPQDTQPQDTRPQDTRPQDTQRPTQPPQTSQPQTSRPPQDPAGTPASPLPHDALNAAGTPTAPAPTGLDSIPAPSPGTDQDAEELARQLARTGPGLVPGVLAAVAALLVLGAGASLLLRGRR